MLGIALLVAEAAWIYTPLADLELTPTIRILLTVAAAVAVAFAGLFAILYERRLARQEAAQKKAIEDLETSRTALFLAIAQNLDARLDPIAKQVDALTQDPKIQGQRGQELAVIRYSTERLRRFAADVRDVTAIGSGQLRIERAPVDLRDIVQSGVAANAAMTKHYNVEVKVHCEASLPLMGDGVRLMQVVNDLLRNAFNFTAPGGTIHVIGGVRETSARITIQDNGRGLTPQELATLFRPFTHAHGPGESRDPGMGLGLYVAKGILQAHGGSIVVESEGRGRGTKVSFEIPLHSRPFDIRNAPRPPAGTPQLPPAMAKAARDSER